MPSVVNDWLQGRASTSSRYPAQSHLDQEDRSACIYHGLFLTTEIQSARSRTENLCAPPRSLRLCGRRKSPNACVLPGIPIPLPIFRLLTFAPCSITNPFPTIGNGEVLTPRGIRHLFSRLPYSERAMKETGSSYEQPFSAVEEENSRTSRAEMSGNGRKN